MTLRRNPEVHLQLMIQDPRTAGRLGIRPADGFLCKLERHYWNGPVSERVAVLDFDHETGKLVEEKDRARYLPPPPRRSRGRYDLARVEDPANPGKTVVDITDRRFNQVSVFGTVLRTMKLFEDDRVLGRRVEWAFDGPQLLLVPRAGFLPNAYYQRSSRSIQLFQLEPRSGGETTYTSLSRDIVAHETAHAILDGIAPDLYHAISPESLALHEAVADLTAVMVAAESSDLITAVLRPTDGAIATTTAFSSIAPEFGEALDASGRARYLRDLVNDATMEALEDDEPHRLCQVLGGALFAVLMKMHEQHRQKMATEKPWKDMDEPLYSCSGGAFTAACFRLRNIIFPALDYLPPGEVSFADYGRAILAVDRAGDLNPPFVRDWIVEEFTQRGIVEDEADLDTDTNFENPALTGAKLADLVVEDAVARRFAEENRDLLRVPPDVELGVRQRRVIYKTLYDADRRERPSRECLFKVYWRQREQNELYGWLPEEREVRRGTTLAIDLDTGKARALLTSDPSNRLAAGRNRLLRRLIAEGRLRPSPTHGNAAPPTSREIPCDVTDGVLRLRGTARLLHIAQ